MMFIALTRSVMLRNTVSTPSVTRRLMKNVPAAVGVPASNPFAPSASPAGSAAVAFHDTGPAASSAVNVCAYAEPANASGK